MHNLPGFPTGQFAIRPGPMMAAADEFEITVTGKGGHAARPHDCIDTALVASHIVIALQSIVSRNVDPLQQAVVSVCTISTDSTAHNVIPQVVNLCGTVRTLDPKVQDFVEERLKQVATGTAATFGAAAEVTFSRGYPVTVNARDQTAFAAEAARKVAGLVEDDIAPVMGAEDFSFMLNERPGAYIFMGIGDGPAWHTPDYNFNDDAIPAGCSWWAEIVESRMPGA